jgi:methionine-gamma-lyase
MNTDFQTLCASKLNVPQANPAQQLPLFLSSSFSFENLTDSIDVFEGRQTGFVYSRYDNPTIAAVADRLARLESFDLPESGIAYMCSSGMAAIHVLMLSLLPKGGKVLTQANLYGGTTELFTKVFEGLGIEPIFTDLSDLDKVAEILKSDSGIKVIYLETPSNPGMDCVDLEKIAVIAKSAQCQTIVDNTFATPFIQRPLSLGIDFVIHSTTKYLNGHGNGIAGVIIGTDRTFMQEKVWNVLKLTGATCNPFDAWLVANGLRTLALRMERHNSNALALAEWLEKQDRTVLKVNYPGLTAHPSHQVASRQMSGYGGMLSFEVINGREGAMAVMDNLKIASIAPTLGDVETLVIHPATSSHLKIPVAIREAQGIREGLIRVSVGTEGIQDLIADFSQALAHLQ